MTLGLVSRRVETEPHYVSPPSEPHMFSEGACDLAVISVWGEKWKINLKVFPDERNFSSNTEKRRRRAKLGFGPYFELSRKEVWPRISWKTIQPSLRLNSSFC